MADPEQLGTAFFITPTGLFLTARHVVEAHSNEHPFSIFVMSTQVTPDFLSPGPVRSFHQVPVTRLALHPDLDAAIGFVHAPAPLPRWKLGTRLLEVGEAVATFGYSRTQYVVQQNNPESKNLALNFRPGFYRGTIDEYLPAGRGNTRWPLYVHSATLLSGISGGPLASAADEAVYGINCTGFEGVEDYGSSTAIKPLLDWPIHFLDGKTIRDLAQEVPGLIVLEENGR